MQADRDGEDMTLEGASVVVVGGSSGMGLATARVAREHGADVTIVARDRARLDAACAHTGARGAALDVTDEQAVERLFAGVGEVDHVAILAGEQPVGTVADGDLAVFRRAMDVRFWGSLYVCRHAPRRMGGRGSITLCGGVVSRRPQPGRSLGTATTMAVEAFGRAMAVELAPVRVNTIVPGPVDTPLLQRFFGDKRDAAMEAIAGRLPAGRVGRPEEVADAIVFLMGNEFVTGVTLPIDGGILLT